MSHSSEMLSRVEALFNEALALPEGDRQALIDACCHGDAVLMAEVLSLLKACSEEEMLASARLSQAHVDAYAGNEKKRVGAYEIDRIIGRGGMGAVYLAHRVDGNFEQQGSHQAD
jgi:hypothetical protein